MKKIFCDLCDRWIKKKPAYVMDRIDDFPEDEGSFSNMIEYICLVCYKKILALKEEK